MEIIKSTKITDTKKVENPQHLEKQERAKYEINFLECENHLALETQIHYTSVIKLYSNGAIECDDVKRVIFSQGKLIDLQYFKYDDLPNRYKRALQEFFKYGNMIFSGDSTSENYSKAIINNMYKNLYSNYVSADVRIYM